MKSNISLIGMAGCGKSAVGVLLAKARNLLFVDTDLLIQQKHGMFLHEILKKEGAGGFKKIEEGLILSLDLQNTCIATGGSVVYSKKGMNHLKSISTVVFLDASFKSVNDRIKNIKTRGLVIEEDESLEDLYYKRKPFYEEYADIRVNADRDIEIIVGDILRHIG